MFSTLALVTNYLRNSCGDERLSDLLVISCLSEDAKDLDLWDVVDSATIITQIPVDSLN